MTADTRLRFAVIGHPIAHSRSPAMHTAAYRALGLPHIYEKIDTSPHDLVHRIADLRHHDLDGLNVTVPHKQAVLSLVDELAPSARAIGAANTIVRTASGHLVAHNTDAPALAEELDALRARAQSASGLLVAQDTGAPALAEERDALRARAQSASGHLVAQDTDAPALAQERDARVVPSVEHGTRAEPLQMSGPWNRGTALVIGSGGAARAAIFALASLGVARIVVRARRAISDATEIAAAGARTGVAPLVLIESLAAPARERDDVIAIVQCTTAGMHAGAPAAIAVSAVAWPSVPSGCIAYDVVYSPETTEFLERARAHGLAAANGLGMLAAQGALAFELWLGVAPPREVMRAAASDAK